MKMLVITSIKEDLGMVSDIMRMAGIPVFSVSDTIGHKTEHHDYITDNWFFGRQETDTAALFFFSFTEDAAAHAALELIRKSNTLTKTKFPIRAFILPVEASSN